MSTAAIQTLIRNESVTLAKKTSRSASRTRSASRKRTLSTRRKSRSKTRSKSRSKPIPSAGQALNQAIYHVLHSRLLWLVCAASLGKSVGTYVASNPKLIAYIRDNLLKLMKETPRYKKLEWYEKYLVAPTAYGVAWYKAYDAARYLSYVASALTTLFAYKSFQGVVLAAYKIDGGRSTSKSKSRSKSKK